MKSIRIKPDEFKLEKFIDYYIDNVEELLSEYPNYISRVCLIDKDYMVWIRRPNRSYFACFY